MGIPSAEEISGQQRFRKLIQKAIFTSPFDATKFAPKEQGSNWSLYPLLIVIHGNRLYAGTSYGADMGYFSARTNVIAVLINYRLNVSGFLSTSDPETWGNVGLWGQQLAIRWVHNNILAFGGDPSRITVGEESTGSVSFIYQILYAGNKGLFQRAMSWMSMGFTKPANSSQHVQTICSISGMFTTNLFCHHKIPSVKNCFRNHIHYEYCKL